MLGFEVGLLGILALVVVGLVLVLYLIPIPLWIAAWASVLLDRSMATQPTPRIARPKTGNLKSSAFASMPNGLGSDA